jgi:hypothetical protein
VLRQVELVNFAMNKRSRTPSSYPPTYPDQQDHELRLEY